MKGTKSKHDFITHFDELTGKPIRQLTSTSGNHHHLYFTSSSFTSDNQHILFISDSYRGQPNLFRLSIVDGETVQLTDNVDGYLKSYVYYDGNAYKGLGKASPSYNPDTDTLLYIQGNEVRILHVTTLEEDVIYQLPPGVMTGFTHLSTNGRFACIPYIPAEAFAVGNGTPFASIRDKVFRDKIQSHLLVIDIETKDANIWFSQLGWITHVQFHPEDPAQILFNHEGGAVDQRIWLYRDGEIVKIRDESVETAPIWICHEMWQRDGQGIIYHGSKQLTQEQVDQKYHFVGHFDCRTGQTIELTFPVEMQAYGHFTVNTQKGFLVTDGVIDNRMIHICQANWSAGELHWTPVCRHNSSFSVQDVHPHPIFSHDDRYILFTSDAHNYKTKGNVYLIENSGN
ncbi:MAG: hypothetical protein JWN30_1074 [Bacilli bacterium]|nr:hypothetical protein [Bacilli bacterium]